MQIAVSPASPVPMVGASGAISGVLGFYFVWFPRNRVRVFLFLFPFFMDVVMLPARLVLGLFIVVHGVDSTGLLRDLANWLVGVTSGGYPSSLRVRGSSS